MGTLTDKLNKLAETKSAIKTAIVNKGVAVSDSDTFASYADKIASISGGGEPTEGLYGVFIYDTNGNLTKPEEWDTANNDLAVGVAVIDENCAFIIGKTQNYSDITWSNKLNGTIVPGIVTIENGDIAKTDYAGEANSSIVRGLTSGEDNAFNWAYSNTITVNGTTLYGYIGALGEWVTAYNNKSSIDNALSKIGGTAMGTESYHCTSTQYSSDSAWVLHWFDSEISNFDKSSGNFMRAFYYLDYPQINDTIPPNKYKLVYRPNQPITTGDFDYLISCTGISYPRFENIEYNAKEEILEYLYYKVYKYENINSSTPVGSITINAEDCSKISYLFGDVPSSDKLSADDLEVYINTSDKLTSLSNLNCYTGNITISNTSKVTDFSFAFPRINSPEFKEMDTSSGASLEFILIDAGSNLIKIAGLSLKSLNYAFENYYFTGWSDIDNLRYVLLKDFGTGSNCTSADFIHWPKWGIEDETEPLSAGARQSLIDTLITYSFDRATAGYSTCTVTLHADTKALLTQDEIAQMTAKGYTLA